jgi:hypothetical protein
MVNPRQVARRIVFVLLLSLFSAASVSVAYGQFTLSVASPLTPPFVDPGGSSIATLDLEPNGDSNPITLTCVVTTQIQQPVDLPTCNPSPLTPITPPAKPSLTINTLNSTSFGLYNIAVTGTSATSSQTITLSLTVVNVTQDYTLSVLPTTASPSPVPAGQTATTIVTVTPIGSYSGHMVTLACLAVNPVVVAAPVCTFTPTNATAPGPVQVLQGQPSTATLTITTLGPLPTTARLQTPRLFYALWLLLPALSLVGIGGTRNRRRNLMGMLSLIALASGILLMPACNGANNTNNPTGVTTPNNTYTFTLSGADENGAAPSNGTTCTTGTTCDAATVTLAVN